MFGYDNVNVVAVNLGDPTADRDINIFRAPCACEILSAYVVDNVGLVAGTANYFEVGLVNGGTAGTGTATIAAQIGGTAAGGTAPAWTVNVAKTLTIVEGTLTEGQYVQVNYDETGTVAQNLTVILNVLYGIAA
jgi:hypothetical protein